MSSGVRTRFAVAAVLAAAIGVAQDLGPSGDQWVSHLRNDLLPFYSMPAALGNPVGEFPSVRRDDGSLDPTAAYRYLVPMSRQVYGYGVAFHMTGDPKYLQWMKAGVEVIRSQFMDRANGGMYLYMDLATRQFGPEPAIRDPQQLGYGLLGLAFYYYLTRDDAVLPDIMSVQRYIYSKYWNASLGGMQRYLAGTTALDLQITSSLDQMNTYLVLLAPIVPEPYKSELIGEMRVLVKAMLSVFYAPDSNLYFTSANNPRDTDLRHTGIDLGHTSKAMWMSRFAGLIYDDPNLVAWAEAVGKRHLARAWIPYDGSWAEGVLPGGDIDLDKNWWVYSELDQLAGTIWDSAHLSDTFRYWTTYFVDHQYGDVWNGVRFGSNAPVKDLPKSWQWKNAYHAFEHALVGYIAANEMRGASYPLYYGMAKDATVQPYLLQSRLSAMEAVAPGIQKATFVGSGPPPSEEPVRAYSSASFLAAPLAPSSFATIFGDGIGSASGVEITDFSGVKRVSTVVGRGPNQVNFVVPAELAPGPATILAVASFQKQVFAITAIAPVSPAIFQLDAAGLVAANIIRVKADGSQSYEPASGGVTFGAASDQLYLAIYATGLRNAKSVSAHIRGREMPVLYAGAQGTDGLDQINLGPLPRSFAGRGRLTIVVTADGLTANPVQIEFR